MTFLVHTRGFDREEHPGIMKKLILSVFALTLFPIAAFSQAAGPSGWNDPFPAHKVMDNFYYVGTKELASFLITTPEGHILMNSNYEASVPVIRAGVEKLGFKFSDIKILIAGHAHPDHVEADAMVKSLTGAQVVVGRLEEAATRAFRPGGKEHPIDRLVDEGDKVTLGGTTLTAHVMPGHTRGCLAWTLDLKEDGKTYHALVECSLNGQFLQSLDNVSGNRRGLPGNVQEGADTAGRVLGQFTRFVLRPGREVCQVGEAWPGRPESVCRSTGLPGARRAV